MEFKLSRLRYRWKCAVNIAIILSIGVLLSRDVSADTGRIDHQGIKLSDYITETKDGVRWTFQPSMRSRVNKLIEIQRTTWKELSKELGSKIGSNIEIRIALNPLHMSSLAPEGAKLPSYATGVAFPDEGVILLTLTAPKTWKLTDIESVLVHELSHLALYRAVDGNAIPRWFSEGVAIYHAQEQSFTRIRILWEASLRSTIIPLDKLSKAFPVRHHDVNLAYAQSADFVGFLLKGEENQKRFSDLIGHLKNGMAFEDAIYKSYYIPLGYLEHEWQKSLKTRFGRWPLLLTAMGTIWVLACVLLILAYLRIRRKQKAMLRRWAQEEAAMDLSRRTKKRHDIKNKPQLLTYDDFASQRNKPDCLSVPTIEYEGQNHTLH